MRFTVEKIESAPYDQDENKGEVGDEPLVKCLFCTIHFAPEV